MKEFAVFVPVFASIVPTHADTTQTWNLTASCEDVPEVSVCATPPTSVLYLTQMEFGTYVDPSGARGNCRSAK